MACRGRRHGGGDAGSRSEQASAGEQEEAARLTWPAEEGWRRWSRCRLVDRLGTASTIASIGSVARIYTSMIEPCTAAVSAGVDGSEMAELVQG